MRSCLLLSEKICTHRQKRRRQAWIWYFAVDWWALDSWVHQSAREGQSCCIWTRKNFRCVTLTVIGFLQNRQNKLRNWSTFLWFRHAIAYTRNVVYLSLQQIWKHSAGVVQRSISSATDRSAEARSPRDERNLVFHPAVIVAQVCSPLLEHHDD